MSTLYIFQQLIIYLYESVVQIQCTYWVTQKLPQIYTKNHATFPIQKRKITVQICSNFWVTQYSNNHNDKKIVIQPSFFKISICFCIQKYICRIAQNVYWLTSSFKRKKHSRVQPHIFCIFIKNGPLLLGHSRSLLWIFVC